MAVEETGGTGATPPVATKTGGTGVVPPATTTKEQFIPRERFEEVLSTTKSLREEIDALKESAASTSRPKGWGDVSDGDLDYIVTHPTDYPEHATSALQERDKRLSDRLTNKAIETLGIQSLIAENAEAFNPDTPLGREVSKILGTKSQKEVYQSVIELAKLRQGNGQTASAARTEVVNNLKTALAPSGGAEAPSTSGPTDYSNMSDADFRSLMMKVKLQS